MRISRIKIDRWLNLEPFELTLPPQSKLVCLVGDNGAGKSSFLELLSIIAARVGFSEAGSRPYRNHSVYMEHKVEVTFDLSDSGWIHRGNWLANVGFDTTAWTGSLTVILDAHREPIYRASGISEEHSGLLGNALRGQIGLQGSLKHVHIDADRSYPPIELNNIRHIIDQYLRQQGGSDEKLARVLGIATKPSSEMYRDWFSYLIEVEARLRIEVLGKLRVNPGQKYAADDFLDIDPLAGFRRTLTALLPHIDYKGPDAANEQLQFVVGPSREVVAFHSLSGGERELTFLSGLVERFQLREGLFLLDEPELHLNPSLVRRWLTYLRDTVTEGQVWIATHSLEAVEVAGVESTVVFEANSSQEKRVVVSRLDKRPAMRVLANALGSPAFSIVGQRFVAIEGEANQGEADRFYGLIGSVAGIQFIEAGTARNVQVWLEHVRKVAELTNERLTIGGVIDRDFRTQAECQDLQSKDGIYVLSVREVENLFLEPQALSLALQRNGPENLDVAELIRSKSDRFAGRWILDKANHELEVNHRPTSDIQAVVKPALIHANFDQIEGVLIQIESLLSTFGDSGTRLVIALRSSLSDYQVARDAPDLWSTCNGKLVLEEIAKAIGITSRQSLERIVTRQWRKEETPEPDDIVGIRIYIEQLG